MSPHTTSAKPALLAAAPSPDKESIISEQAKPAELRGLHYHHLTVPELTVRGMVLGALITVLFTSSNVYPGLKVGLTFSSSIPAAVISMAVLSFFARSNILENNMIQTQASAAGTLSAVIFMLPAILWSPPYNISTAPDGRSPLQ